MDCKHENKEFKKFGYYINANDPLRKEKRWNKTLQCNICGARLNANNGGAWWPKNIGEDITKLPEFDHNLSSEWAARKRSKINEERKNNKILKHQEYEDYIQRKPEWKERRELVMTRCGGICEGCLIKRATEVHHLNYDTLFDELLWDLKGVCRECHMKAHNLI